MESRQAFARDPALMRDRAFVRPAPMCGPPPYGARFHARPHQGTEEGIRKKRKDEAVPIANTLAKNAADRKAYKPGKEEAKRKRRLERLEMLIAQ